MTQNIVLISKEFFHAGEVCLAVVPVERRTQRCHRYMYDGKALRDILVQIHMNAQIRNREHLQSLGIGRIR